MLTASLDLGGTLTAFGRRLGNAQRKLAGFARNCHRAAKATGTLSCNGLSWKEALPREILLKHRVNPTQILVCFAEHGSTKTTATCEAPSSLVVDFALLPLHLPRPWRLRTSSSGSSDALQTSHNVAPRSLEPSRSQESSNFSNIHKAITNVVACCEVC